MNKYDEYRRRGFTLIKGAKGTDVSKGNDNTKPPKGDDTVDERTVYAEQVQRQMPPLRTWAVLVPRDTTSDTDETPFDLAPREWMAVEGHAVTTGASGELVFQRHTLIPGYGVALLSPVILADGEWFRCIEQTGVYSTQIAPS